MKLTEESIQIRPNVIYMWQYESKFIQSILLIQSPPQKKTSTGIDKMRKTNVLYWIGSWDTQRQRERDTHTQTNKQIHSERDTKRYKHA